METSQQPNRVGAFHDRTGEQQEQIDIAEIYAEVENLISYSGFENALHFLRLCNRNIAKPDTQFEIAMERIKVFFGMPKGFYTMKERRYKEKRHLIAYALDKNDIADRWQIAKWLGIKEIKNLNSQFERIEGFFAVYPLVRKDFERIEQIIKETFEF